MVLKPFALILCLHIAVHHDANTKREEQRARGQTKGEKGVK
jgi:hypothetical protein